MKKQYRISTIVFVLVFLAGLSLLLYPTVSDRWNAHHQSIAIRNYNKEVDNLDNSSYDAIWQAATDYNASISSRRNVYVLSDDEIRQYNELLNVSGTNVMGYVEIPEIKCTLPVYHGTDESALQAGVGHFEWSSLPVGGESSHAVLSSHRGLPSARLFTDLDKLENGDIFMLHVLNDTLTYEVDQILIVEPEDLSALHIVEGEDLCTLVTCTPYGINSHRLLVRGHRVENDAVNKSLRVTPDATRINTKLVALCVAVPVLVVVLVGMDIWNKTKKKYLRWTE